LGYNGDERKIDSGRDASAAIKIKSKTVTNLYINPANSLYRSGRKKLAAKPPIPKSYKSIFLRLSKYRATE
jgi:hypothetical protein